jgi:biotin carboxylase
MRLYLLACNPTDSVSQGFLPAAAVLGLDVVILTDQPEPHRLRHPGIQAVRCDVRAVDAVVATIAGLLPPAAIFSNSDHLQAPAALAAAYFGLPGKDWRTALRVKNKAEMRRRIAAAGLDTVWSHELSPSVDPATLAELDVPFPCVIKPREGVASEDVVLAADSADLVLRGKEIRQRRPGAALVVEEFLQGELHTLETLGDGTRCHVLGGFKTTLSPPPNFIELRLDFVPSYPESILAQVLAQLDALGVGFGVCHTEFVVHEGRARLIEVNYRAIGDQCDLLLERLLGIPLFERILRIHLGESLPIDSGVQCEAVGRVDYLCATESGTLTAAPESTDTSDGGVTLIYRQLREIGRWQQLSGTNRDYIGVLRSIGPDSAAVNCAAEQLLSAQRWEINP